MRKALETFVGSVVVYVVVVACAGANSGGGDPVSAAGAGDSQATGGAEPGAGGSNSASGATTAGNGGLLDPVPTAGAQVGGGGGSPVGPALGFTKHVVACDQEIKIGGTNWPAAIVSINPPDLNVAAMTLHVAPSANSVEGNWLSAGAGGFVQPDGSRVAINCVTETDQVTFYVPAF